MILFYLCHVSLDIVRNVSKPNEYSLISLFAFVAVLLLLVLIENDLGLTSTLSGFQIQVYFAQPGENRVIISFQ